MRYDKLLAALKRAEEKYEMEVKSLLRAATKSDDDLASWMLSNLPSKGKDAKMVPVKLRAKPGPKPKKLHWTQTPAGRRKMAAVQKAAWAKKIAAR